VNFFLDRYAPDHQPHKGQRVWVSMTQERALQLAKRNVLAHRRPGSDTDEFIESLAASYYSEGNGPDLQVFGYAEAA
jgi:hypothetical protein